MAGIEDTLRKAGWTEVGKGAGLWHAPGEKGAGARKWRTGNAALEAVRRKAAEPPPEKKEPSKKKAKQESVTEA
jgi:hypothetical protein